MATGLAKRILVYDVAAQYGGAKSVLDEWYRYFVGDKKKEYYLATSLNTYDDRDNLKVIYLPWVKKSWIHRIICDTLYVQYLIKKYNVEEVISLQNIPVLFTSKKQTVYVQNVIPFSKFRFNLFKEPILWVNKQIIGKFTKYALKKADKIIVQTVWMKKTVHQQLQINDDNIVVQPVQLRLLSGTAKREITAKNTFFYPATPLSFKNHKVILSACKGLMLRGVNNYEVLFTFHGNENSIARSIKRKIEKEKLPIKLIGPVERNKMEEMYRKTILIFPSKMETVGLPLKEAQQYSALEIVAHSEYSRESVGEYNKVIWFGQDDDAGLSEIMKKLIAKR